MTQSENYLKMIELRQGNVVDSSYKAAFYLLCCDEDLSNIAFHHIDKNGVEFLKMIEIGKSLSETQQMIMSVAYNLFKWDTKCIATPFEISRLGYPYMEQVVNAIFIASEQYEVQIDKDTISLDKSKYEETKRLHSFFDNLNFNEEQEDLER